MNTSQHHRYSLKQYIRLIIAFYGCLLLITLVQYSALRVQGVIDNILTVSFLIATIHQIGFASILGILLVAPFNFFENLRPKYGFRLVSICLGIALVVEVLLTAYFLIDLTAFGAVQNVLHMAELTTVLTGSSFKFALLYLTTSIVVLLIIFLGFYKGSLKFYEGIGRMYPFTIILFSLFLMALFTEGKPIDQNKTQYLIAAWFTEVDTNHLSDNNDDAFTITDSTHIPDYKVEQVDLEEKRKRVVLQNDQLMAGDSLKATDFTNGEVVYINSTYNGSDADREFKKARNLAINTDYQRAILICRHILSEVPNHIDAKILLGRLNAWQGKYEAAKNILHECISMYPEYIDSYAALFDVYYWSNDTLGALALLKCMQHNSVSTNALSEKIVRANRDTIKAETVSR